jgi:sigma-E factor negative regulatory protein RseC
MCGVADMEEKIVETPRLPGIEHKIGDKVTLIMKRTSGNRAVFLGYYLPFLIVVITLILMLSLTENEGLSGLVSIGILLPYYLILFMIKDRLTKKMEIRVKR